MGLAWKVALITGPGSGIDAASTFLFHEESARVVLTDIDGGSLEERAQGKAGGQGGSMVSVSSP